MAMSSLPPLNLASNALSGGTLGDFVSPTLNFGGAPRNGPAAPVPSASGSVSLPVVFGIGAILLIVVGGTVYAVAR